MTDQNAWKFVFAHVASPPKRPVVESCSLKAPEMFFFFIFSAFATINKMSFKILFSPSPSILHPFINMPRAWHNFLQSPFSFWLLPSSLSSQCQHTRHKKCEMLILNLHSAFEIDLVNVSSLHLWSYFLLMGNNSAWAVRPSFPFEIVDPQK